MDEELKQALNTLVDVHTKDDDAAGFQIVVGATPRHQAPWISDDDYVRAWETVRKHLWRQINPSPSPTSSPHSDKPAPSIK